VGEESRKKKKTEKKGAKRSPWNGEREIEKKRPEEKREGLVFMRVGKVSTSGSIEE